MALRSKAEYATNFLSSAVASLFLGDVTVNQEEFLHLLSRNEGKTLDFKATHYDFSNERKRADFVKDVLAMANTPREEPAYIVLGVEKYVDGRNTLRGLNCHVDDADLQAKFDTLADPIPDFSYDIVSYDDKDFGIITIPPQSSGPFHVLKNFPSQGPILVQHTLYFRRGSRNTAAQGSEHNFIHQWFVKGICKNEMSEEDAETWAEFLEAVDNFSPSRRYVLLASPLHHETGLDLSGIGVCPWNFVCDFDPSSVASGLHSACAESLTSQRRSRHDVVAKDRPILNPDRATYWFFARGLEGRQSTLSLGPWKEWVRDYQNEVNIQFRAWADSVDPSPITCIVVWYESDLPLHLDTALQAAQAAFGEAVEFVFVSKQGNDLEWTARKYEAKMINIPLHHLCSGLTNVCGLATSKENTLFQIPSSSGAPVSLALDDQVWLAEEMEVVHLGVGSLPETDSAFLRGAEADWYELSIHEDVDRDQTSKIFQTIQGEMRSRRAVRVNLYHAPGAGGTTVARRILWDLHSRFPCAILHRCEPAETADRIYHLHSFTGLPILLLIDGSQVVERQSNELFNIVRSRQIPVVLFQVLRRFKSQTEAQRSFYLPTLLSEKEAWRFSSTFSKAVPEKRVNLERLVASKDESQRTAFYFGLETFGHNFRGIESYVRARLSNLTDQQRTIVCFLSLAHRYAQRPLRNQVFAQLLGLPKNRGVELKRAIDADALELLVEVEHETWRTAHDLVAQEVLQQILPPPKTDKRTWKQFLSKWGIDFARFCRGDELSCSLEMLDLAKRTFIYRDNSEIIGTERTATKNYSQLIEDIPSREGRLEVLKAVVEMWAEEAHFHAHLGRFYAYEIGDFERALECCDRAIQLQDEEDHVLHHMKGMVLRQKLTNLLDEKTKVDGPEPLSISEGGRFSSQFLQFLEEATELAQQASNSFERARKTNPEDEYSYVSEAQMLLHLLNYIKNQTQDKLLKFLERPSTDPYLKESLERVEDLLEHVRRTNEGEGDNTYEQECRARLNSLYGRHEQALQSWDALLNRSDTFHPPLRRQIIWTYLARRNRSWHSLTLDEVERIVHLLDRNLEEEPHNEKNLRLWVQAIRVTRNPPSLESIIERVTYWKANSNTLEATYYLYVFHTLASLEGSFRSRDEAIRFQEECSLMARARRNRTRSFEWLGHGLDHHLGVKNLVHYSSLGRWDRDIEFWESTGYLGRIPGRITHISGPQQGTIEIGKNGMTAFFVPTRSNHYKNRSENQEVEFFLGFSYDGLRAWEVQNR